MFGRKKKTSVMKIEIAQLSPDTRIDEGNLVEIKDEMILARLNQSVPEIARAMTAGVSVASTVASPAYKCVLPAGATSVAKGAVKGIEAGASIASVASLSFSVAALIVGQKFMSDVSKRLEKLNESIACISDFQNNEYKSRVDALILRIAGVLSFRSELTRNEQARQRTLSNLDLAEAECAQLLGQANETIEGLARRITANFELYNNAVQEIERWLDYQNKLLAVLFHISELKYALNFGTVSKEYCSASFQAYLANVLKTQQSLKKWHMDEVEKLSIDVAADRRKRKGADAFFHALPALFNDERKYRKLPENTAKRITEQRTCTVFDYKSISSRSFDDDVEIIVKDGKVYYLESVE